MRLEYKTDTDGVILTRLYGDSPVVIVPSVIADRPVIGLGEYCFSEKSVASDGSARIDHEGAEERALSGDYITEVSIPETVKSIGDLCFYGCRKLKTVELYDASIGSDAFMNCHQLSLFILHKSVHEKTALRRILMQRNAETYVRFDDAEAYFPEFTEHYDLIGPAHIFELAIDGEGLRARQCFEDDVFKPEAYDVAFQRAVSAEDERTLCRMAAARLQFPEHLSEEARNMYEDYISEHIEVLAADAVLNRDLGLIIALAERGELSSEQIKQCLMMTTKERWIEGTRMLLGVSTSYNN